MGLSLLRAALAAAVLRPAGGASACSQNQWGREGGNFGDAGSSSCDYLRDGECDVDLGYCGAGTDCADCDPCSDAVLSFGGCSACLGAGSCQWCAASETCTSQHGASHLGCSGAWISSGCPADTAISGFSSIFNDPAAVYQKWYLEAINVGPVWAQGITGAGVNIFFQDDGLDIAHLDFQGKFDASVSVPSDPTPTAGAHGTACAGFAVAAANNGVCGIGVAYDASISFSVMNLGLEVDEQAFTIGVANGKHHVHSHSWGNDACPRQETTPADNVHLVPLTGCPFVSDAAGSPCSQNDCSVDWGAITIPDACVQVIQSYCSSNIGDAVGVYDPACADFWDLYVQCNHNSLSNQKAQWLRDGVTRGRGGKGIVYVFAAGNEFDLGENVNFEGWLNSIYTITVGATARDGKHAYYSSAGAAVFVSAPGGEAAGSAGHGRMVTTLASLPPGGAADGCANQGQGTSYSTPLAAGVAALMLQANPELGWRDVQDILARTSQKTDSADSSWVTNGAGLSHSDKYGFGQIDAGAAVARATSWSPSESKAHALLARPVTVGLPIPQDSVGVTSRLDVSAQEAATMESVEHVVVYITTDGHTRRGDLEVTLTSPAGTASLLVWTHHDTNDNYERFKFMTVKSWGESAIGIWSLKVKDRQPNAASGNFGSWILAVYGKCTVSDASSCRSILRETVPDKCEDTCQWASDTECDDVAGYCPMGTDCSDCGPRSMRITYDVVSGADDPSTSMPTPAPTPSPPTPAPTPSPPTPPPTPPVVASRGRLGAPASELVGALLLAAVLS